MYSAVIRLFGSRLYRRRISASALISRRNLALHGQEIFDKVREMVAYARGEINQIGDYYAYSKEIVNGDSVYDFDITKLSVNTLPVGLAGIEVYDLLCMLTAAMSAPACMADMGSSLSK